MDARYAAGFIDGEGMLSIEKRHQKSKRGTYVVRVHVENVDPRPLQALRERFGGSLTAIGRVRKATHRPIFVWVVTALAADKVLRAIAPHLIAKREQAELLLEMRSMVRGSLKGLPRGCGDDEITRKEALRLQVRALKHQAF